MILHYLQVAVAHASFDLLDFVLKSAGWLLAGGVTYMANEFRKLSNGFNEFKVELAEWRVHIFGYNGDNGLSGTVEEHTEWISRYERRHGPPDRRQHTERQP